MQTLRESEDDGFYDSDRPQVKAFQTIPRPKPSLARGQEAGFELLKFALNAKNETGFFEEVQNYLMGFIPFDQIKFAFWDDVRGELEWLFHSQNGDPKDPRKRLPNLFEEQCWDYVSSSGLPLSTSSEVVGKDAQEVVPLGEGGAANRLFIPVVVEGSVGGMLSLYARAAESFSKSDEVLMAEMGRYFGQAWKIFAASGKLKERVWQLEQNCQDYQASLIDEREARERSEMLQKVLVKVADAADSLGSKALFYDRIYRLVKGFIKCEAFYVGVIEEINKHPSPRNCPLTIYPEWDHGKHALEKVSDCLVQLGGESASVRCRRLGSLVVQQGIVLPEMVVIPLRLGSDILGGFFYLSHNHQDQAEDLIFLLAQYVASSIARFQASERMQDVKLELEERVHTRTLELSTANVVLEKEIEERGRMERRLIHEFLHDPLTGLPNRTLFMDRLNLAYAKWSESQQNIFAVLFLDLDRFKVINDSVGHLQGDALLKVVAYRIQTCTRNQDTVARLGGDEFAILLEGIQGIDDAKIIAARIFANLELPIDLEGIQVYSSVSIGIAQIDPRYQKASNLLRDADAAMYRAKEMGRRQWVVFDESMHHQAMSVLSIESDLRGAFEKHEFHVAYQPIVCMKTGKVMAFEALVRWYHSEKGLIMPGQFIPLAEETGLIIALDWCVFKMACLQMVAWKKTIPNTEHLKVSINLSSKHFTRAGIAGKIIEALGDTGLDPHFLKLEITETVLLDNFPSVKSVFQTLQEQGVEILLDDFGTGYSSLNYLHRFPVNCLKIDRSFISKLDKNQESKVIVRSIGGLAEGLNIKVVAEGIENKAQYDQLAEWGCDFGQGFWISKPLSTDDVTLLLQSGAMKMAGLSHHPSESSSKIGQ